MPWPWAILAVIAFMLSTVVWSFAVSSFAFATPCVTLPEFDATSRSIRSTSCVICDENSLKFAVVESMLARLDSRILRSSCDRTSTLSTIPVSRSSPSGAAERLLQVRRDVADVDLDVPREPRDLVEGDRGLALEDRAFRERRARRRGPG